MNFKKIILIPLAFAIALALLLSLISCAPRAQVNLLEASNQNSPIQPTSSSTDFYLMSLQHKITLPEPWSIEEFGQDEYRFRLGEDVIGGMFLVGFYDQNHKNGLPNHSEIIKSEKINSKLGEGNLYILNRSTPSAELNKNEWFEIHAIIPTQFDKGLAYAIWFQSPTEKDRKIIPDDVQINSVKEVINSIEMTGQKKPLKPYNYVDNTYNFSLTFPAEWEGKYVIEERDKGIIVHYLQKEVPEMQASLFSVSVRDKKDWEKDKDQPGTGAKIGENKDLIFVLNLPFDNPFEGKLKEEYGNMVKEVKEKIAPTFRTK